MKLESCAVRMEWEKEKEQTCDIVVNDPLSGQCYQTPVQLATHPPVMTYASHFAVHLLTDMQAQQIAPST